MRVRVQVGDVDDEPAIGALDQFGERYCFVELGAGPFQQGGDVLQRQWNRVFGLRGPDVVRQHIECTRQRG